MVGGGGVVEVEGEVEGWAVVKVEVEVDGEVEGEGDGEGDGDGEGEVDVETGGADGIGKTDELMSGILLFDKFLLILGEKFFLIIISFDFVKERRAF